MPSVQRCWAYPFVFELGRTTIDKRRVPLGSILRASQKRCCLFGHIKRVPWHVVRVMWLEFSPSLVLGKNWPVKVFLRADAVPRSNFLR